MDVRSGKVVVALELIPTSKSPLGSDIPKGTTGQPSIGVSSSNDTLDQVKNDREGLALGIRDSAFLSWAQIGPWDVQIGAKGPKWG